jgi:XTP/dITP diphosphohydrolase
LGICCFADDTGLEVEALGGAPGVLSARYAGDSKDSQANIQKLIIELKGKNNRNARFRTVMAYVNNQGYHLFEGIVNGQIIDTQKGTEGFGYDPIFVPEGYDITFAQMSSIQKNGLSHRGRAMQKLISYLDEEN